MIVEVLLLWLDCSHWKSATWKSKHIPDITVFSEWLEVLLLIQLDGAQGKYRWNNGSEILSPPFLTDLITKLLFLFQYFGELLFVKAFQKFVVWSVSAFEYQILYSMHDCFYYASVKIKLQVTQMSTQIFIILIRIMQYVWCISVSFHRLHHISGLFPDFISQEERNHFVSLFSESHLGLIHGTFDSWAYWEKWWLLKHTYFNFIIWLFNFIMHFFVPNMWWLKRILGWDVHIFLNFET